MTNFEQDFLDSIIIDIKENKFVYVVKLNTRELYRVSTLSKPREEILECLKEKFSTEPNYKVFENGVLIYSKNKDMVVSDTKSIISTETRQIYDNIEEAIEHTGFSKNRILHHLRCSTTRWAKFRYVA